MIYYHQSFSNIVSFLPEKYDKTTMSLLRFDESVRADGKEIVDHKTDSLLAAAYQDDVSVNRITWHWHDEFELCHLLQGRLTFVAGTEQFGIDAGDALFINSQVLHGAWSNDSSTCPYHSVVFHSRLVSGGDTGVFWDKYVRPVHHNKSLPFLILRSDKDWSNRVINNIEDTWTQLHERKDGFEFIVRNMISESFYQIYLHTNDRHAPLAEAEHRRMERLKIMITYIEEHLAEEITVRDIASAAYVSNSECDRCFKCILKATPIQYLKQLRLQRAEHLLTSTKMSVESIALLCGFRDMSYFARCFRNAYDANPLAYRKGNVKRYIHTPLASD